MHYLLAVLAAGSLALFPVNAGAAGDKMTIAVFTKNLTNPAYDTNGPKD
jgi:hypothetical protein